MFAIIDCGTTNTRVYIVDHKETIIGRGERRVGVRNTSMTGSKEALRTGLCEAIAAAAQDAGIDVAEIEFAIASGMITSEIGLMEIPHLIAPVGLEELADSAVMTQPGEAIPMGIPILFIRGIRNNYGEPILQNIRNVDFMRGEEVQMMGILDELQLNKSVNVIVLSSHTKLIHANAEGQVVASLTNISGQLYEAVCKESMIGKSLIQEPSEEAGGYTYQQIVDIADEVSTETGLDRVMLIPRFMQVLLKTDYKERNLFIDAGIASDDMRMIEEFNRQGYHADTYVLFGHQSRCEIYDYLIHKKFGSSLQVITLSDKEKLSALTVRGAIKVAQKYRERKNQQNKEESSKCTE